MSSRPAYERTIAGLARMTEVALAEHRLTIQKYRVLSHLAREPLSPSELAERLSVKPPVISRIVEALLQRRYIERCPDAADGRRSVLALTRSGRALLARADVSIRASLEDVVGELDAAERESAFRGLALWSVAFGRHVGRARND